MAGPAAASGTATWVLVAAIVGSSMAFIDGTAVNVALPLMQADLRADAAQVQWVVEGYALFLSALILIGGSFGDMFGRRRTFITGIGIFVLGSAACALAPTINVLIGARCLQGIGGALATPQSLALISAAYQGAARGRAIGSWSGAASITAAAGPVLGGFLAQHHTWRDVFLLNVPLGAVVLAIAVLRVPESRDESSARALDVPGALLATAGLGALVFGLIRLQDGRFDLIGAFSCAAGLAALAVFLRAERGAAHPMMPLALFRSRPFSAANVYTFFLYAALGGALYFVPFVLIDVQRYSPTAAGAALLPFVIIQFGFSRWSGGLAGRIGSRTPLVTGALLAAAAFALYARPGIGETYWTSYFPAAIVLGAGGAFFIAPLTTLVMDAAGSDHSGIASGINNAVSRTAGLIAVAALGIVLAGVFASGFDARITRADVSPQTRAIAHAERARFTAGTVPPEIPAQDRAAVERAIRLDYLSGFRAVMLLAAALCVGSAGIALAAIPPGRAAHDAG